MPDGSPIEHEEGIRHRFRIVHRDRTPGYDRDHAAELAHWCRIFDDEGLAPVVGGASAGNLSFRTTGGFMITPSRSALKTGLSWTDFVEVVRADYRNYTLHVRGSGVPSSDSFLHDRIYARRLDVLAVFHGHDDLVLAHADQLAREFPIVLTPEARAPGTQADAEETARDLGSRDYLIRTGHGFVATGRTLQAAGELSLKIHRRAVELAAEHH